MVTTTSEIQAKGLRKIAIGLYGEEETALMTDKEIAKTMSDSGYQTFCALTGMYQNDDMLIMNIDVVNELVKKGLAKWVNR